MLSLRLKHNSATGLADLLVSQLAHIAGLDNAGYLQVAVAEELSVSAALQIHHRERLTLLGLSSGLGGNQPAEVVQVDGGLPQGVLLLVVLLHAQLTKIPGMVLVKVDAVVVLATGVTTTGLVLSVLADAAITAEGRAALVASLLEPGRHPVTLRRGVAHNTTQSEKGK